MPNFAIVIGIDAYTDPRLPALAAAARDALRFAEWVIQWGGVPPENLQLLLSGKQLSSWLPFKPATSENIRSAVKVFQEGAGHGGDRLYFFYAGHGISASGATNGRAIGATLVPVDVSAFESQPNLLIVFQEEVLRLLKHVEPTEQIFILDACLNYTPVDDALTGTPLAQATQPLRPDLDAQSRQYVLYATVPGGRAYEDEAEGIGIFANALMQGLMKTTPALRWSLQDERYVVLLSTLWQYVDRQVKQRVRMAARLSGANWAQDPTAMASGDFIDPTLVFFDVDKVEPQPLTVLVTPEVAHSSCVVEVVESSQGGNQQRREAIGPPVDRSVKFKLIPPGTYTVVARANQFTIARRPCELYEPLNLQLDLQPEQEQPTSSHGPPDQPGSLSIDVGDTDVGISVWNIESGLVGYGKGHLLLTDLRAGQYRVQLVLPEGSSITELVEILPGRQTTPVLQLPPPQIGPNQLHLLEDRGISIDQGRLQLSRFLGSIATPPLASVLAFSAFAALWPDASEFQRLKSMGVRPLNSVSGDQSTLLVLVGVSGKIPGGTATGVEQQIIDFLHESRIVVYLDSLADHVSSFTVLSGFPSAAEFQVDVPPGMVIVELTLPGFTPTRYPLVCRSEYVAVLVVVVGESRDNEVQQYLLLRPMTEAALRNPGAQAERVRQVEMAQRYYSNGKMPPLEAGIAGLLTGEFIDPILGCLAGYALLDRGDLSSFIGQSDVLSRSGHLQASAMQNLLTFFPDLPDTHILAGLCQPEQRDEHFRQAVERGVPVFARGLNALHSWYIKWGEIPPPLINQVIHETKPGSLWTAWTPPQLPLRSQTFALQRELSVAILVPLSVVATLLTYIYRNEPGMVGPIVYLLDATALFLTSTAFLAQRRGGANIVTPVGNNGLPPHRLAPTARGGLYGGMVGGAVAGFLVGLAYKLGGEGWGKASTIFVFAEIAGAVFGSLTLWSIAQVRRVLGTHQAGADERIGGLLGGLGAGVVMGCVSGLIFGQVCTLVPNLFLFVLGIALGAALVPLNMLLFDYQGRRVTAQRAIRAVLVAYRKQIAATLLITLLVVITGVVLVRNTTVLNFFLDLLDCQNGPVARLLVGATLLGALIGSIVGFQVGLILYQLRKWQEPLSASQ